MGQGGAGWQGRVERGLTDKTGARHLEEWLSCFSVTQSKTHIYLRNKSFTKQQLLLLGECIWVFVCSVYSIFFFKC